LREVIEAASDMRIFIPANRTWALGSKIDAFDFAINKLRASNVDRTRLKETT
jgi:hypothetical protein